MDGWMESKLDSSVQISKQIMQGTANHPRTLLCRNGQLITPNITCKQLIESFPEGTIALFLFKQASKQLTHHHHFRSLHHIQDHKFKNN